MNELYIARSVNGDMSLQNEILNCRMYLQPLYWAIKRGQDFRKSSCF